MRGPAGRREVASLAWPLAVGMLSFTLMGVVDTLLMGRVGTAAQAGVGLGAHLTFVAIAFFRGLTSGAQSLVAAADGAGDRDRVRRAGGAGVALGLGSGLAAGILLLAAAEPLLAWTADASPAVAASAGRYVAIRALGLPLALLGFGFLTGLQGIGDTRSRMWISLVGNVVNAGLDLVLIFGWGPVPAMHEAGAAWATVFSSGVMAALYGARSFRRLGRPRRPTAEVLRAAVAVGLPAGAQALLGVAAFATVSVVLSRSGPAHLAASEIALNVTSVSFLPGFGVGEAGGVLVGRYLGAGRLRLAARAVRSARSLAVLLMAACGVFFLFGGESIAACFTTDAEVARLAGRLLMLAAVFQVFDAVAMVHLCALRGAGDTRFTLVAGTLVSWGVMVPAVVLFVSVLGWGAPGAWLALMLEIVLLAAITSRRVAGLRVGRVGRPDLLLGARR